MRFARFALAAALIAAHATPALAQDAPLIPRKLIFGNPTRSLAKISPDGRQVSWLAPVDGVMNVWVAPAGEPAKARAVTRETKRPLAQYWWSEDSKRILYQQDDGGDENWRIHAVDLATGQDRDLLPVKKGARVDLQGLSPLRPSAVLLGSNERNAQYFDLYEIDLASGARKLVLQNPGYGAVFTDNLFRPRVAQNNIPGGDSKLYRAQADGRWTEFDTIKAEDFFGFGILGFDRAGTTAYLLDSRGRDTTALVAMDVATGRTRPIAASDAADIANVEFDPKTFEPVAYSVNRLKNEWKPVGAKAPDLADLDRQLAGADFSITSRTDDGSKWIVQADKPEQPAVFYEWDRRARKLTKLVEARPDLAPYKLAGMQALEVRARDGLSLPTYISLPPGSDKDGNGVPDQPLPTVLFVHGGPWSRDDYGYYSSHQWLANRGYAVISVNYRGSTGFGKKFVNAAVGEWSGKMHDDLIDVVDWAAKQGIADAKRTAIMGGSYGGYATLVGVTFTPDRFRCGVDIVGPSNLKTLMESFPPYWRPILAGTFFKHVGDPAKPDDVKRMMAQSPITRVDAIKVPLLIGQGANDPRVVKAESDQIVAAMKAKGLPVTYVLYPDEGHGFQRPENRLSFFGISEGFLAQCLGGRAEPLGDDLKGSSLQVLEGADRVPGLTAALARPQASSE